MLPRLPIGGLGPALAPFFLGGGAAFFALDTCAGLEDHRSLQLASRTCSNHAPVMHVSRQAASEGAGKQPPGSVGTQAAARGAAAPTAVIGPLGLLHACQQCQVDPCVGDRQHVPTDVEWAMADTVQ